MSALLAFSNTLSESKEIQYHTIGSKRRRVGWEDTTSAGSTPYTKATESTATTTPPSSIESTESLQLCRAYASSQTPDSVHDNGNVQCTEQIREHALAEGQVEGSAIHEVCFGTITANVSAKSSSLGHQGHPFDRVTLEDARVSREDNMEYLGSLDKWDAALLESLCTSQGLRVQLYCYTQTGTRPARKLGGPAPTSRTLHATLYGSLSLSEQLCEFLESHEIFLQDPLRRDIEVDYHNPQRLFPPHEEDEPDLCHDSNAPVDIQDYINPADVLKELECADRLRETDTPAALTTPLYKHQREALTFMLGREREGRFDGSDWSNGIWRVEQDVEGVTRYVNNVTEEQTFERPHPFYGGILADEMGLGKTLTALALIASDKVCQSTRRYDLLDLQTVPSTLLVVRAPLLKIWDNQMRFHIRPGELSWTFHHASRRIKTSAEIVNSDIIITTYNTLVAEWKRYGPEGSLLFRHMWQRIVLDEAHDIRDHRRLTFRVIYALKARSRWALTGTPIQNRLLDIASLFQFLREPHCETASAFRAMINHLVAKFGQQSATDRLRALIQSVMLRRSKVTVELPERRDLIFRLDFTSEEQRLYNELQQSTLRPVAATSPGIDSHPRPGSSVLAMINRLRLTCNLGILASDKALPAPISEADDWSESVAQELFNGLVVANTAVCRSCSTELGAAATEAADHAADDTYKPAIYKCGWLICGVCWSNDKQKRCDCRQPSTHSCFRVSTMSSVNVLHCPSEVRDEDMPTKIRAVLRDLLIHSTDEKCVIFSYWTSTLELIEQGLQRREIPYIRFDGTVSQGSRNKALERFCSDPSVRVALLTISCGAVGLHLTAASRAYLMEPNWNPSVEQQALARVHRMGQTRPVTTIRYVMRNTLEDYVVQVQHEKQELSRLLLSDSSTSNGNEKLKALQASLLNPVLENIEQQSSEDTIMIT